MRPTARRLQPCKAPTIGPIQNDPGPSSKRIALGWNRYVGREYDDARARDGRLQTNIGKVSTLDYAAAAFKLLYACPIPNGPRADPQARSRPTS